VESRKPVLPAQVDRFLLEEEIMKVWSLKDNIDLVYEKASELKDPKEADFMANILLGVSLLFQARMDKLFTTFEELIRGKDL